jgi:hypothetical protein
MCDTTPLERALKTKMDYSIREKMIELFMNYQADIK